MKDITYKREVWQAPSGQIIRAKLSPELRKSHFGPKLRTFIINLYAQGMTQPEIYNFLHGTGVNISSGQINNIFLEEAERFTVESEKILQAGLSEASYIRVDDTGARHRHKNGYCTHIGGEHFAYYKTTPSKSRANFLSILSQGKEGYIVNNAMIWHLYQSGVRDDILNLFEELKGKRYRQKKDFRRFLTIQRLYSKKLKEQCIEAGYVGFIAETILKKGQVLLSDRAGQFAVFDHAGCWVHMERPLRKVIASSKTVQKELKKARESIWELYSTLNNAILTQTGRAKVNAQYDALVKIKSSSPTITNVIESFRPSRTPSS